MLYPFIRRMNNSLRNMKIIRYMYHFTHCTRVLHQHRSELYVSTLSIKNLDVSFLDFRTIPARRSFLKERNNRNESVMNHRILRSYGKNSCWSLVGRVSFLPTRYLVDIALSVEMGTQQRTSILTLYVSSSSR